MDTVRSTGSWDPRDFSSFQISSSYKSYFFAGCASRAIWFSGMSISKKEQANYEILY